MGGGRGRGRERNGVGVGDVEVGLLRCEQPPELRGLVFLDLDPHAFCSAPLVLKLAIQDIQPFSVLVSWQSRNHSGLHGYQVAYHALDNVDEVSLLIKAYTCTCYDSFIVDFALVAEKLAVQFLQ